MINLPGGEPSVQPRAASGGVTAQAWNGWFCPLRHGKSHSCPLWSDFTRSIAKAWHVHLKDVYYFRL